MSTGWLDLELLAHGGRSTGATVLLPLDAIESVQPAYARADTVGSIIRTRSGAEHGVGATVATIRDLIQRAIQETTE